MHAHPTMCHSWVDQESLYWVSPQIFLTDLAPHLAPPHPQVAIKQSEAHILFQRKQTNNQQAVVVLEIQNFLRTTLGKKDQRSEH